MKYRTLSEMYEELEQAGGRREMIGILVELLRDCPRKLVEPVTYLCQGKIAPDFAGVEMGMAEKSAARAVGETVGAAEHRVLASVRRTGDLGTTAGELLRGIRPERATPPLNVRDVFERLHALAAVAGAGAQARKREVLAALLRRATPLEGRYLVRTVTGKLRLGVGDATLLDALAEVYAGGRAHRPAVERAYNWRSDLGEVAAAAARGGVAALDRLEARPGHPVRPMLAQRVRRPEDILRQIGGECAAEYKYDGERVQIHRDGGDITLFSRRLERITDQFPDVIRYLRPALRPKRAILEAEIVAVEPESGDLRPFQELMHRRRQHGVAAAVRDHPIGVFLFDVLYADGKDLTRRPYPERRAALARAVSAGTHVALATQTMVRTAEQLEAFFEQALTDGCEGVVCKSVAPHSTYAAGSRGYLWIKYKREYVSSLQDTLDLVVVGAFHGRGRRRGRYGALLLAARDGDRFPTVCKVGTGFTDAHLDEVRRRLAAGRTDRRPPRVESKIEPDVWFQPELMLEIIGGGLTLSPLHTAGWGRARADAGLAVRFPRFTGRFRDDKAPQDATSVDELWDLYRAQGRGRKRQAAGRAHG